MTRCRAAALGLLLAAPCSSAAREPGETESAYADGAGAWKGRIAGSWFVLPDAPDYLLVTAAADRGPLHLEGRYNYEDRETASVFAGWAFGFGDELKLQVVPMLGGVVGRTNGFVPGLELTIDWRSLEYYLETEYVIDLGSSSSSYFYAWAELTVSPARWLQAGLVLQRTRVIRSPHELVPGLLVRVTAWQLQAGLAVFDPGSEGRYASLSLTARF